MSLTSLYEDFLRAPNAAALADKASLHYITTLTSIHDAPKVIKQLTAQHLRKREEKIIDAVEGQDSIALEVATTIEFLIGGGAYLPGLDDNFLADRIVNLPMTHIVHFDPSQRIQQIRISWDQGCLLKNLEVIGARGKNWPIRDGIEQARLIASSRAAAAKLNPNTSVANDPESITANRGVNNKNVTRDPHASLALFGPRETTEESNEPAAIAPRASSKPPPRDYHDLFVGNDSDASPSTTSKGTSFAGGKPSKEDAVAPKGGSSKNYQPSRLFDNDENSPAAQAPTPNHAAEHLYKANPKKYHHFDFADGSEEQDQPKPSPLKPKTSKHASQWGFEDFVTPQKPSTKVRSQDVRHFGWSDDEANQNSPVKQTRIDKPRRDAETHFEFRDDGTPQGERRPAGQPRGASHNEGLGLYKNNLYDEDENAAPRAVQTQPLGTVTNINSRRKDFDSQFSMTDDSPATKDEEKPIAADRQAAVKMMDSTWDSYDQSPEVSKKENVEKKPGKATNTGIMTAGDGMGGRKGTGRQWGFGDDSDGEEAGGVNSMAYQKGVPGKKQQAPASSGFWDF